MTKLKLSDSKFIQRSAEKSQPRRAQRLDAADLTSLRGLTDRTKREATHFIPGTDGTYEPVSFTHPDLGRRVYGWLVGVEPSGDARVEIGDGEYAVVPPDELRRLGKTENRQEVQERLRRAIGQVSLDADGVRADFHQTGSMTPLSAEDDSLQLLPLAYSTQVGMPTDQEVLAYVERFHPTASVVEVDTLMPGRIGVALHLAEHVEAEFDGAVGGEVIETLDPAEVSEEAAEKQASEDGMEREAGPLSRMLGPAALAMGMGMASPALAAPGAPQPGTPGVTRAIPSKAPSKATQPQAQAPQANPYQNGPDARFYQEGLTVKLNPDESLSDVAKKRFKQLRRLYSSGASAHTPTAAEAYKAGIMQQIQQMSMQKGGSLDKQAWPWNNPNQAVKNPKGVNPNDAAKALVEARKSDLIGKVLQVYMANGGAKFLAELKTPYNTETLLGAAIPTVQRVNPALYRQVAQVAIGGNMTAPADPTKQQQQQQQSTQQNIGPQQNYSGERPEGLMSNTASRRAGIFEKQAKPKAPSAKSMSGGTPTIESAPAQAEVKSSFSHLTDHGLPPSMLDTFRGMSVGNFGRRGDYVIATVKFEPAVMKGRTAHSIKSTVQSFVKAKCGINAQGANFGIIGKVYVISLDEAKGSAVVQFASEYAGPSALITKSAGKSKSKRPDEGSCDECYCDNQGVCHNCGKLMDADKYDSYHGEGEYAKERARRKEKD